MSPFSATATSHVGTLAARALGAERHQQLAVGAELEDLFADAVAAAAVGDPERAETIDADAVRPGEHLVAPHLEDRSRRIQLDDGGLGTVEGEDLPVGIDRHAWHFTPRGPAGQDSPVGHQAVGRH